MDRIYLDHNATSPLAPAVKSWLAKGDFVWANPASQHSSGKKASFELDTLIRELFDTFHLTSRTHQLIYHSGATEAINSAFMGFWLAELARGVKPLFVCSPLDHSAVKVQLARLKMLGAQTAELVINDQGELQVEESVEAITQAQKNCNGSTLINFTWVHNETGVVWPLSLAERLKERTSALIHVDAAQAIGKVENCWQLSAKLDQYSFSSHKCGGLKSHGWSFISKEWPGQSLILGGGQQKGLRAGTENVMGAQALHLALAEIKQQWRPVDQKVLIAELRSYFDERLQGKGQRVCAKAQELNLNTVFFVLERYPSDMSLPLFDLNGLEVSSGSACSSGAAKANANLERLGFCNLSRNGLRLSLPWGVSRDQLNELCARLDSVFVKIK